MTQLQPVVPHLDYKPGGDIRFVMATGCQSGCDFCHLEGHKAQEEIGSLNPALAGWKTQKGIPLIDRLGNAVRGEDVRAAIKIARLLGLNKIHLTGGEPTLHPHALNVIRTFIEAGMQVGMTSHGEISSDLMDQFLHSGLSGINFSLHAITPDQYLEMDLVAQGVERNHGREAAIRYAQGRLTHKLNNIQRAVRYAREEDRRFRVKANCVIRNVEVAIQIVEWCCAHDVDIRLQRDLNNKRHSEELLDQVIARLDAVPVREDIAIGDSSGSGTVYQFKTEGRVYEFKIKEFGDVYVTPMCHGCPLKGTPQCREHFYGVRIEHNQVTTCIDLNIPGKTSFAITEFIELLVADQGVPGFISGQYNAMRRFTEK